MAYFLNCLQLWLSYYFLPRVTVIYGQTSSKFCRSGNFSVLGLIRGHSLRWLFVVHLYVILIVHLSFHMPIWQICDLWPHLSTDPDTFCVLISQLPSFGECQFGHLPTVFSLVYFAWLFQKPKASDQSRQEVGVSAAFLVSVIFFVACSQLNSPNLSTNQNNLGVIGKSQNSSFRNKKLGHSLTIVTLVYFAWLFQIRN